MLVWFADWLASTMSARWAVLLLSPALRAAIASGACLTAVFMSGDRVIGWLARHAREPNKSPSSTLRRLHAAKDQTPTMGGAPLALLFCVVLLCCGDVGDPFCWSIGVCALGLAAVGAWDDWIKLRTERPGISALTKLSLQALVAAAALSIAFANDDSFAAAWSNWGDNGAPAWAAFLVAVLAVVGMSNAVNLTDGLDGLAAGCLLAAYAALAGLAMLDGHASAGVGQRLFAGADSANVLVACAALVGATAGFLVFNRFPARVFLGNVGSLPLGGLLGLFAAASGARASVLILGGVFVAEALSVVVQVGMRRLTGRGLLRCAPLHHHFQFLGHPEPVIVRRFWAAAIVCAIAGVLLAVERTTGERVQNGPAATVAAHVEQEREQHDR